MTPATITLVKSLAMCGFCYLLGAVPFSYIITRAVRGIDLRKSGSGNLGTANTARTAGLLPALLVFAGDFGKGALGVAIAVRVLGHGPLSLMALAAVVLGHNFSPFVGFSGGKGLAAAAGGLLVFSPWLLLATGTLGLTVLAAFTDFYLAAMVMAAALPGLTALFAPGLASVGVTAVVAVIVLVRHRANLPGLWPRRAKAGAADDLFALVISVAALAVDTILMIMRSPASCFQLPLLVIAGRWVAAGFAILAAWSLLSRFPGRASAFAAGALAIAAVALTISPLYSVWRGAALLLPSLMTQIGGGNWPYGQVSVAAVGAHHLLWVVGLSVAALISRALGEPPEERSR